MSRPCDYGMCDEDRCTYAEECTAECSVVVCNDNNNEEVCDE